MIILQIWHGGEGIQVMAIWWDELYRIQLTSKGRASFVHQHYCGLWKQSNCLVKSELTTKNKLWLKVFLKECRHRWKYYWIYCKSKDIQSAQRNRYNLPASHSFLKSYFREKDFRTFTQLFFWHCHIGYREFVSYLILIISICKLEAYVMWHSGWSYGMVNLYYETLNLQVLENCIGWLQK